MSGSRKLLLIALDAASPPLLKAWAADGTLPNIAKLMATGLVGETRNVKGFEGATWPSFYTGTTAAKHGFYWVDQLQPGTYRRDHVRQADFIRRKTFWEVLSDAGRRVLLIDVPLSRLSQGLNGAQVIEWGGHDSIFGHATIPASLKAEIRRAVGDYPAPRVCDTQTPRSLAEYFRFRDQLLQGTVTLTRLTRKLLAEQPWDVAIQAFGECHCAGHQLWHFHDPRHPGFDAKVTEQRGDPLREIYTALDVGVGAILSDLGPETTVVLFSLHGMSYTWGAGILLSDILARLGIMTPSGGDAAAPSPGDGPSGTLRGAYYKLPRAIRGPLYNLRQRFKQRWLARGENIPFDPRRSQCFLIEVGRTYSGIRLNLKAREPEGTVEPGQEAEAFIAQLSRDLLDLTNPDTGRRLVRAVLRTAELYQGPCLETLPDLVVDWDPEARLGTTAAGTQGGAVVKVWSAKLGLVQGTNTYCRTGDHQLEGMFIARGPGVRPGTLGRTVSNLDLAPTFVRMLGSEMPDVDGRPIAELLGGAPG